jgi:glycine/D-amino acid oxidase-like deaminating enzyme
MTGRTQNWGKTPWKVKFRAGKRAIPREVDIAIVGAGFTGLAAAACVTRNTRAASVLVLEAGTVGAGASGRTGGMALAGTAAGNLPGLGDVLRGYRKILRELEVNAEVELPGAWEIARGTRSMEGKIVKALKNSPMDWSDSGRVRAVGKVPGGTIDPGKMVSGLARAAQRGGARIAEQAEVRGIEFTSPVRLHVLARAKRNGKSTRHVVTAKKVLLATNAGGLELTEGGSAQMASAEPKLTFAIATAPLGKKRLEAIGMKSGKPFYTVDLPYLWGRRMKNSGMIFGSGLVPAFGKSVREISGKRSRKRWSGLEGIDVSKGEAHKRLDVLERRVRGLHPALNSVCVTHRWGGPILITRDFLPIFRTHPKHKNVILLSGYSGHGVALSVYLGKWAADALAGRRALPDW